MALQVVGLKMTGRIEEVKNVAMHIVGDSSPWGSDDPLPTSRMSLINSLFVGTSTVSRSVHHLPPSTSSEDNTVLSPIRPVGISNLSSSSFLACWISTCLLHRLLVPERQRQFRTLVLGTDDFVLVVHRLFGYLIQHGIDVCSSREWLFHFAALLT